jgi:hypothetical protein
MFLPPITGNAELDAFLYEVQLNNDTAINTSQSDISNGVTGTAAVGYNLQYLHIKYADDNLGGGLSNSQTNKDYFGLFNSASSTESTNPADYTWFKVTNGFGASKNLYYIVMGGRLIQTYVGTNAPTILWSQDTGTAINLDVISTTGGKLGRVGYAAATNYTMGTLPSTVTTVGNQSFPAFSQWGANETWQGTPPTLATGEGLYIISGVYDPATSLTTWTAPYLASVKVLALSAVSANLGTVTAGKINAGDTTNGVIIDADTKTIKVYNAGVLRVQIGNLAA